jgi:diguanylate cyclase (GGDEF)-like protein
VLRPTDTIARLGGDLFAILIEDVNNPETPIQIASRIQNKIRKYLSKLENELQVRANVGIILCGTEYASVDDILHAAESALELAKSDRKQMLQLLRSKSFEAIKQMGSLSPIR